MTVSGLSSASRSSWLSFRLQGTTALAYRTDPVTRGDIQQTVTATGTVNAVTTVLVGTQVSGTIKSLFVDFNSRVKKGQIIAQIDPAFYETQVAQAQANCCDRAQTRHCAMPTGRSNRNKDLFAKNLIAKNDLDTAETNYDSAKAQLAQAKAALQAAETNLRYTKISSPVDGIVISRNVDVGQTVAASFQTPTLFTIAQDLTKMQIDTNVAESDIGVVKVGQDVEFTVDAYPDTTFKGKVWQKQAGPHNRAERGDLRRGDPGEQPRSQAHARHDRQCLDHHHDEARRAQDHECGAAVPDVRPACRTDRAAAERRPGAGASEKKGPSVWVLENGKPKRVGITPGISDGNYTEIVSGDLKEGQQIIVESLKKERQDADSDPSGPRMF